MPIGAGDACARQGGNEAARAACRQPVSARLRAPPRPPSGVRYVGNRPWDRRSTLTVMTALLLAGQAAATTARRVQNVPRGALPPPAMPRHGFHPGLFTSLTEPLAELANQEALAVAEESGGGGSSLLWQGIAAWFADPCTDLDQYANGFWKLGHPPAREQPSHFGELKQAVVQSILVDAPQASAAGRGAEAVLATIWASAQSPSARQWSAFQPQLAAIRGLSSRDEVERHLCQAMSRGQASLLGVQRYFRNGVLVVAPGRGEDTGLHALPTTHPRVVAHRAQIGALLSLTGMPAAETESAARTIMEMERIIAAAPAQLQSCTREQAERAAPGFPWATLWQALGLDPMTALFTDLARCRQVGQLLMDRPVEDWKVFLRYREAAILKHALDSGMQPPDILRMLDQRPGGRLLLSSWYAARAAPEQLVAATRMFDALKQVFRDDVAASALPAEDRVLLDQTLAATRLVLEQAGSGRDWTAFPAGGNLVANLQSLAAFALCDDLDIIEGRGKGEDTALPAHHLSIGTNIIDGLVRVSPAMLASLAGQAPQREARWATLGMMIGHELGHVLSDAIGLSDPGQSMMAQDDAAIRQRIGDLWIGTSHLDATRVLDEAGADLRGLSAALRAGEAEAAAAGRSFDRKRFFVAAAGLHAANPTARQLRAQIEQEGHPPGPFRAELGRSLKGFDAAFGCEPRPNAPFDRILPTAAGGWVGPVGPNTG